MEITYECGNIKLLNAELCVITGYPFKCEATQIFCLDEIESYKNYLSSLGFSFPRDLKKKDYESYLNRYRQQTNKYFHLINPYSKEEQLEYIIDSLRSENASCFLILFQKEALNNTEQIDMYFRTFNSFALNYDKVVKIYYHFDLSCIESIMNWFVNFYIKQHSSKVNQIELFSNPQFMLCKQCNTKREQRFFSIFTCRETCDFCVINSNIDACLLCNLVVPNYNYNIQICSFCGKTEAIREKKLEVCLECAQRRSRLQ